MRLQTLEPGAALPVDRRDAVVLIPVFGGHELFVRCLTSVVRHTPPEVPILIADDAGPDERTPRFVAELAAADATDRVVYYLRQPQNLGFPENVNTGFAAAAPADVALVTSDVVVAEGWLGGLRAAAESDSTVATATALTNHGSIVSTPRTGRPGPLPQDWTVDGAAAAIAAASLRIRPRLPTAVGHCIYVKRSALDLVGGFDPIFAPGYGEEVDFSQRCVRAGLCHVLADDVFVEHAGSGTFAVNPQRAAIQEERERIVAARYPYYHPAVKEAEEDVTGPLARALGVARRALEGPLVIIDGRVLGGPTTGTQLHVVEVIAALARTGAVRLEVIIPARASDYAQAALGALSGVELLTRPQAIAQARRRGLADVVHRPYQVDNEDDLSFLAGLGERIIISQQDLIGYHNPSYFRDFKRWDGYRHTTRRTLSVVDRVLFGSAHARDQAVAEDLLEPSRATVVPIGVDHQLSAAHPQPVAPRDAGPLAGDEPIILCIGTDFRHKNRVFALRLLGALRSRGWTGRLVLAGPSVAEGSSAAEEAEAIAVDPGLAGSLLVLPALTEAEKEWVYQRSSLVLYPTVHEGFGLVPFEAADHGLPCLWAPGTSLSDVLDDADAGIVPWDAAATADAALSLLDDAAARTANVAAIRAAASRLTWDAMAARLVQVYLETCDAPATPAGRLARSEGFAGGRFSEDAMRLVGPGGALPEDVERPLLAIATHPQVGRPIFGAMRLLYRAGFSARRRGGAGTAALRESTDDAD